MIFRDFNHWFSSSNAHGRTSYARDWLEKIWNELVPTMEASLDDHKRTYLELCKEKAEDRCEFTDAMLEYIDEHKRDGDVGFFRWWLDRMGEERDEQV